MGGAACFNSQMLYTEWKVDDGSLFGFTVSKNPRVKFSMEFQEYYQNLNNSNVQKWKDLLRAAPGTPRVSTSLTQKSKIICKMILIIASVRTGIRILQEMQETISNLDVQKVKYLKTSSLVDDLSTIFPRSMVISIFCCKLFYIQHKLISNLITSATRDLILEQIHKHRDSGNDQTTSLTALQRLTTGKKPFKPDTTILEGMERYPLEIRKAHKSRAQQKEVDEDITPFILERLAVKFDAKTLEVEDIQKEIAQEILKRDSRSKRSVFRCLTLKEPRLLRNNLDMYLTQPVTKNLLLSLNNKSWAKVFDVKPRQPYTGTVDCRPYRRMANVLLAINWDCEDYGVNKTVYKKMVKLAEKVTLFTNEGTDELLRECSLSKPVAVSKIRGFVEKKALGVEKFHKDSLARELIHDILSMKRSPKFEKVNRDKEMDCYYTACYHKFKGGSHKENLFFDQGVGLRGMQMFNLRPRIYVFEKETNDKSILLEADRPLNLGREKDDKEIRCHLTLVNPVPKPSVWYHFYERLVAGQPVYTAGAKGQR